MRKIIATTLAFAIIQLILFASVVQTVYSEGVPREVVTAIEVKAQQKELTAATPTPTSVPTPVPTPVVPQRQSNPVIKGNQLSIPSIGLAAPVVNVGVTAANDIDVPSGRQIGYWTGGAKPGTTGAVFLDGHVDGVFVALPRIAVGQTVNLRYGEQTYTYRVVHKETVPLAGIDMNRALRVHAGASEGLNMMTCAGKYMPSQGTYDQRLVVYTVRI